MLPFALNDARFRQTPYKADFTSPYTALFIVRNLMFTFIIRNIIITLTLHFCKLNRRKERMNIMKLIKKSAALLLALAILLALAGCGGSASSGGQAEQDGGVPSGQEAQNSEDSGNALSAEAVKAFSGSGEAAIYKVGSDKLAFLVKGDCCKDVAPRDEYTDGTASLWLACGDDWETQCSFYSFNANVGYNKNGEWTGFSSEYKSGIIASEDMYFVEINNPGICNEVKLSGSYELRYIPNNGENSEKNKVASGKISDILREVSDDDFPELRNSIYMSATPLSAAKADWAGKYLADYWSDTQGYVKIEVSEKGLLHFHTIFGGEEKDFYGEERDYDKASYDYGDYESAQCEISGNSTSTSFRLSKEAGGEASVSFNHSDYGEGKNVHISADLTRIDSLWRQKPDGYDDTDRYGKISDTQPGDAQYFAPITDDYIIRYSNTYSMSADEVSYPCSYSTLYSFDANGFSIDSKIRYLFESEDAASKVFATLKSDEYSTYDLSGKAIYYHSNYQNYYYDNKIDVASYNYWYVGCNYIYDRYVNDSEYYSYSYLSVPFTEEDFGVTIDDVIFWRGIKSGDHYSFDTQGAFLYTYVGDDGISLNIYEDSYGENAMSSYLGYLRFHGRSAEAINYNTYWDDSTNDYLPSVVVKELSFTEEEASVTEYTYRVESYADCEVTLDNYKTNTPDKTLTHRFDMTRVRE